MIEIVYRHDPEKAELQERPADAQAAKERLRRGNVWFSSLVERCARGETRQVIPFDLSALVEDHSDGEPEHRPFAAVLSCSDARVPTELVFHQAHHDLFVVRLAGNVIGSEALGSLNFAVRHLAGSVKLLVVLGHTGCGAVTAAVDAYLEPGNWPVFGESPGLRSVLSGILMPVRIAAGALERVTGGSPAEGESYRERLMALAVPVNAALVSMTLHQLVGPSLPPGCGVAFGIYDLMSREVWAPGAAEGLADPPASFTELEAMAESLARKTSDRSP